MEQDRPTDYLAFLLRLWREDVSIPWRVMLVNPHTGEKHGFADLIKLHNFLQDQTSGGIKDDESVSGLMDREGRHP